jgi:hypothetical protein
VLSLKSLEYKVSKKVIAIDALEGVSGSVVFGVSAILANTGVFPVRTACCAERDKPTKHVSKRSNLFFMFLGFKSKIRKRKWIEEGFLLVFTF